MNKLPLVSVEANIVNNLSANMSNNVNLRLPPRKVEDSCDSAIVEVAVRNKNLVNGQSALSGFALSNN